MAFFKLNNQDLYNTIEKMRNIVVTGLCFCFKTYTHREKL